MFVLQREVLERITIGHYNSKMPFIVIVIAKIIDISLKRTFVAI